MSMPLIRFILCAVWIGLAVPAAAYEPPLGRWTRIGDQTTADQVVNYGAMTVPEAEALLARSQAAVLYDRSVGFDSIPEAGVALQSVGGAWGMLGPRREAFRIQKVPETVEYGVFAAWSPRKEDRSRIDGPDAPVEVVLGIPTRGGRSWGSRETSYDPLVAVMGQAVFVAQYVNVRMRDPLDPTRDAMPARIATATVVPFSTFLDGPAEQWRIVLTLQSLGGQDPRVVFLPVTAGGALDTSRDGAVLRLSPNANANGVWTTTSQATVVPRAIRLHLGDRASLRARLANLPPPPRERFVNPGGPTDPLMAGPRSPRDPYGGGVEVRSGVQGELDLLSSVRTSSSVQPAFSGVNVEGWLGRVGYAVEGRSDLFAVRAGGRLGGMRDTNYTFVGAEVGTITGGGFTTGRLGRLALNGVVQSRRLTQRTLLGLPFEMGNAFRVGTSGVEYELMGGLRGYAGKGFVVTPAISGGFRYQISRQRGFAVFGLGVEVTRNYNVFKTR